jgi:S1-C subfamily serine protease
VRPRHPFITLVRALGTAALVLTPTVVESQDATIAFRKVRPSIAFIETNLGGGTGFCVDNSGIVATALHVVDGASSVAVTIGGNHYVDAIDLVAIDENKDLALIKPQNSHCVAATLSRTTEPEAGTRVFVVGNPLAEKALEASITDGLVSGLRDLKLGHRVLQISAPLSPGNSGGPVVNAMGNVLGVVVFKLTSGELLNFAVPAYNLRALLAQARASTTALHRWSTDVQSSFTATADPDAALIHLFAEAKLASGTCALIDYKISDTVYREDGSSLDREVIEGKFGAMTSWVTKNPKTEKLVRVIQGHGTKGAWRRIGDDVKPLPQSTDQLINFIVNNYYCFCDEFARLWVHPEISEESFHGEPALRLSTEDKFLGSHVTFWFSKSNHLVIGRKYMNTPHGVPVFAEDRFSDFRRVDGFVVPFITEQTNSKPSSIRIVVRKFEPNVGYPEYVFNQLP